MKKIFVTILVSCFAIVATAQIGIIPHLSFGYNYETEKYNKGSESEDGFGLGVGGQVEIALMNSLTINPGLSYTYRTVSMPQNSLGISTFQNKHNLEVPIFANYYFGSDRSGLFVGAGPKVNLLLGGGYTVTTQLANGSIRISDDIDDDDYSTLGLALGVNIGYQLKNGLRLALTYDHIVTNMYDSDEIDNVKLNSGFIAIQVGWRFSL